MVYLANSARRRELKKTVNKIFPNITCNYNRILTSNFKYNKNDKLF